MSMEEFVSEFEDMLVDARILPQLQFETLSVKAISAEHDVARQLIISMSLCVLS